MAYVFEMPEIGEGVVEGEVVEEPNDGDAGVVEEERHATMRSDHVIDELLHGGPVCHVQDVRADRRGAGASSRCLCEAGLVDVDQC